MNKWKIKCSLRHGTPPQSSYPVIMALYRCSLYKTLENFAIYPMMTRLQTFPAYSVVSMCCISSSRCSGTEDDHILRQG